MWDEMETDVSEKQLGMKTGGNTSRAV